MSYIVSDPSTGVQSRVYADTTALVTSKASTTLGATQGTVASTATLADIYIALAKIVNNLAAAAVSGAAVRGGTYDRAGEAVNQLQAALNALPRA